MNNETRQKIKNGSITGARVATPTGLTIVIILLLRILDKLDNLQTLILEALMK